MKAYGAGCVAIAVSILAANAGFFPLLGMLVAFFAPDAFLLGVMTLIAVVVAKFVRRRAARVLLMAVLTVLVALNTRLPSVVSDAMHPERLSVDHPLLIEPGTPLRIKTNVAELRFRRMPGKGAEPACRGEGCFSTAGFENPSAIEWKSYEREAPVKTATDYGFTIAGEDERAPTLYVDQQRIDRHSFLLQLALEDENGVAVARFSRRFRDSYPWELADSELGIVSGTLLYLLHGNSINGLFLRLAPSRFQSPVHGFLRSAAALSAGERMLSATAKVEIVAEKIFEPARLFKDEEAGTHRWTNLARDRARKEQCEQFLSPRQADAGGSSRWRTFRGDASGRKRLRSHDVVLCDADVLWLITFERPQLIITKYNPAGDSVYRLALDLPKPLPGFESSFMQPTFATVDGYLQFEWWDTLQTGRDRVIKRELQVRVKEPV